MLRNTAHWYESTLLGGMPRVSHGFSTRQLGDARNDSARREMFNRRGMGPVSVLRVRQVHGSRIVTVGTEDVRDGEEADGIVTGVPGRFIGVVTADCVPLLLSDPDRRVIGAVHAGWRGALSGVVETAVSAMEAIGARTANIRAAIGPHIGACCYLVGDDRAHAFVRAYGSPAGGSSVTGTYADLGIAVRTALIRRGVLPEHIDHSVLCTSCQTDRFYSYRKDTKGTFGEMIGYIGMTH